MIDCLPTVTTCLEKERAFHPIGKYPMRIRGAWSKVCGWRGNWSLFSDRCSRDCSCMWSGRHNGIDNGIMKTTENIAENEQVQYPQFNFRIIFNGHLMQTIRNVYGIFQISLQGWRNVAKLMKTFR